MNIQFTERRSSKAVEEHPIPAMTDPLGRHWDQPSRNGVVIDNTHAICTEAWFKMLRDYSSTIPTGVYPGKMWRRHDGAFDPRCKPKDRKWMLCWYGDSDEPDRCSINCREVLFI